MPKKQTVKNKAVIRLDREFKEPILILFEKDGTLSSYVNHEGHDTIHISYYINDTLPVNLYSEQITDFLKHLYYVVDYKDLFFIEEDKTIYELIKKEG